MPSTYKTECLVLRRQPFREADRRIVVLTPGRGKLILIARGASKIKSKLAAHLEPFSCSQIMVAVGKNNDTVAASMVKKKYITLGQSLLKKAWADYVAEIVDHVTKEGQSDPDIYCLVNDIYKYLDDIAMRTARDYLSGFLVMAGFVTKLISHLGYHPELNNCSVCHKKISSNGNAFDFTQGGVVCKSCYSDNENQGSIVPVTDATIKMLRFMFAESFTKISKLKATKVQLNELKNMIDKFLAYYIEVELKSVEFIRYLNRQKRRLSPKA
ncbi:DNA repair protein RecO [Patescibacteria group bacterium]|nr:DNA repair protein RecO [Patescibacteria group bacterium]MBU1890704.1 DNA repair protein RecO [Patescibacteria group bacterium]